MVAAFENRCSVSDIHCENCGRVFSIIYNREDMVAWLSGSGNIQTIMPYLSPGERELLLSNTCNTCFDAMFPPDLDIDD